MGDKIGKCCDIYLSRSPEKRSTLVCLLTQYWAGRHYTYWSCLLWNTLFTVTISNLQETMMKHKKILLQSVRLRKILYKSYQWTVLQIPLQPSWSRHMQHRAATKPAKCSRFLNLNCYMDFLMPLLSNCGWIIFFWNLTMISVP